MSSTNYVGNVQAVQTPISTDYTNLIINGDMAIDQRYEGTSTPSIYVPLSTTVNQYGTDRNIWSASKASSGLQGVSDRIITERRALTSLTAPIPTDMLGLNYALRFNFEVDSAGSGGTNIFDTLGSGKEVYFSQLIENTMYANLGWGKDGAKSMTISFWYMTETSYLSTQYFNVYIKNQAGTHIYRAPITADAPRNTWRKVIVSVPPPPVGSDWTGYMRVGLCMFDRTATSTSANAWDNTSMSYGLTTTNAVNMFLTGVDTVPNPNAWFHLTGLQVQQGGATPFAFRTSFQELKLCERYYEKSYSLGIIAGTITTQNSIMLSHLTTGGGYMFVRLKTSKYPNTTIANTQVVIYNPAVLNTTGSGRNITAGTNNTAVVVATAQGHESINVQFTTTATLGQQIAFHYVVNVEFI